MENPFERLQPPPGGVEGLRRKLEAPENRRAFFNGWKHPRLVTTAMVASIFLVIGYSTLPLKTPPTQDYGIFQHYMEAPPADTVSLVGTESSGLRLVQQPSGNPVVKMYWIEEVGD